MRRQSHRLHRKSCHGHISSMACTNMPSIPTRSKASPTTCPSPNFVLCTANSFSAAHDVIYNTDLLCIQLVLSYAMIIPLCAPTSVPYDRQIFRMHRIPYRTWHQSVRVIRITRHIIYTTNHTTYSYYYHVHRQSFHVRRW